MTTEQTTDPTAAERQRRARERWRSGKLKRVEFKVPEAIVDDVRAMVRDRIARHEAGEE